MNPTKTLFTKPTTFKKIPISIITTKPFNRKRNDTWSCCKDSKRREKEIDKEYLTKLHQNNQIITKYDSMKPCMDVMSVLKKITDLFGDSTRNINCCYFPST